MSLKNRVPALAGLLIVCASLLSAPAQAVVELNDANTDNGDRDYRSGRILPGAAQLERARALKAQAKWNRFGTVHTLIRHGGYLGTGYAGAPEVGARAWILENRELFRLSTASVADLEVVNNGAMPHTDAHAVLFRQRFGGLKPTSEGQIAVGIVNGKVYYASSSSAGDQPLPGAAVLTPLQAWLKAAADLNRFINTRDVLSNRDLTASNGWHMLQVLGFSEAQRARLIAVPMPSGGVRQAYETIVLDNQYGHPLAFVHWIDAETGAVLRRQNHVNHQAGGGVPVRSYQGSFSGAENECAVRHDFPVGSGSASLQITLSTVVPTNAASIRLYRGEGDTAQLVARSSPTIGGGAEIINYAPSGGVPEGNYQVEACLGEAFVALPPYNYVGTFVASPVNLTGTTGPVVGADGNAPRWRWFPGTPDLSYATVDTRKNICFATLPDGTPLGGCDFDASSLASRQPWDMLAGVVPTFTTIGNNAITAGGAFSPLTPSVAVLPVAPSRQYEFAFNNAWHESNCNPAGIVTSQVPGSNGNDLSAVTVNLFVAHNRMHDFAYGLGFTERNYNLQLNNFGLTPVTQQNDPELGTAQAGAIVGHPLSPTFGTGPGRNNANQVTLMDGVPGVTNQYLFQPIGGVGYPPCADGSWDMGIIGHEYTHAISNRMAGGPDGNLGGAQAGAMGESWGDLTAMEYMLSYGFVPQDGNNQTPTANYTTGNIVSGIRNYAPNGNPLNYSNISYDTPGLQVHADGEIWTGTQWDVRQTLVEKYDAQYPHTDMKLQRECADGKRSPDACPGNRRWIQMIFDAWLLLPGDTSMLDARDAMLASSLARYGDADQADLWRAFARRGMGEFAYTNGTDDPTPIPSFESPFADDEAVLTFKVSAADGDKAPITTARLIVGKHSTRSRQIADTDPITTYDPSLPIDTLNSQIYEDTAKLIPGTYDFVVVAPGYGIHKFEGLELKPGPNTLSVKLPTNWASVTHGATALTQATGFVPPAAEAVNPTPPPITPEWLIDDSEDTGTLLGDDGNAIGAYAIVSLGGGSHEFSRMNLSVAAGPTNAGRWGALRKFEVRGCNGDCSDAADFTQVIYTSADDFFPGGDFRPGQKDMNLRSFSFDPVTASHIQLVTLTTQCYGHPRYVGDIDSDPLNNTDCPTARGLITGLDYTLGGNLIQPDPGSYSRATDIQVYSAEASYELTSTAAPSKRFRYGGGLPVMLLLPLLVVGLVRRRG